MLSVDYQQFDITEEGISVLGDRMLKKLKAIEPTGISFKDRTVLDIGCDHGFWCFLASDLGAREVLGVDRGRNVKGEGVVDLVARNLETSLKNDRYESVDFEGFEAGKQWHDIGPYNLVLLMSLYHHVYQNTGGDHKSIWYWLWRQTNDQLLWENPTDSKDSVVQANVDREFHSNYTKERIVEAASEWFDIEYQGPAEHEPYREVWLLKRKLKDVDEYSGSAVSGAGGASKAFVYNDNARIKELGKAIGYLPFPGSLNVVLDRDFDWDAQYYRSTIKDVVDRQQGIDSQWADRPVRLYPVMVNGQFAHALRFEGESYPDNFIELISAIRLRDVIGSEKVIVRRWQ